MLPEGEPEALVGAEATAGAAAAEGLHPIILGDALEGEARDVAAAHAAGQTDEFIEPCVIAGPTCDSVDRLPGEISLPEDIQEGDYVVFHGAGAYSVVTNTRFNGFGELRQLTVMGFD